MSTHKNRRLFDLAHRNSQRRAFEKFYKKAPLPIKQFLDTQIKIFHPDTPELVKNTLSKCNHICSKHEVLEDSKLFETPNKEKAYLMFLSYAEQLLSGEYFVWLGGVTKSFMDEEIELITLLPSFYISLTKILPIIENFLLVSMVN